jgi:hypothetical protein
MEYYLYISHTKIEMMYDQLSGEDSRSSSIKAKIAVPQIAEIESQRGTSRETTLYQKLDRITKHLSQHQELGSITTARLNKGIQYIQDTGKWKSAILSKDYELQKTNEPPVSYVVFCKRPGVLIFLVGSPKHILGTSDRIDTGIVSPSWTVDELVMNYANRDQRLDDISGPREKYLPGLFGFMANIWEAPHRGLKVFFRVYGWHEISNKIWADSVDYYNDYFERAKLENDVLSKPDVVLVGSPIFVALDEVR